MGFINRLGGLFRRSCLERDLDEELQFHIELKTRENIAAGMPPRAARHQQAWAGRGAMGFRGEPLKTPSPRRRLQRGIVQVPQNHSLFREMTVRENVELGAFLVRDRSLVQRRYDEICDMLPIVGQRAKDKAGSLSGGQQRLVEFARCLMLDPVLVVLDEPSMGLDPRTRRTVFETIRSLHKDGRTILLVEQNARAALKLADRGYVLETGSIVMSGTSSVLTADPAVRSAYLGM